MKLPSQCFNYPKKLTFEEKKMRIQMAYFLKHVLNSIDMDNEFQKASLNF